MVNQSVAVGKGKTRDTTISLRIHPDRHENTATKKNGRSECLKQYTICATASLLGYELYIQCLAKNMLKGIYIYIHMYIYI